MSGLSVLRERGVRGVLRIAARRTLSVNRAFGLVADPREPTERKPARIPVTMEPHDDPRSFRGFDHELTRVTAADAADVAARRRLCAHGVEVLYVATDDHGAPIYCQWLVDEGTQAALHRAVPQAFPELVGGEGLLEGAYTFVAFRGQKVMADAMHQLLMAAREHGLTKVYTYVTVDNVPSLRGCARVGFGLDHVRVSTIRLGRRTVMRRPPTSDEALQWERAVR
jgi:hypothetical protein